MCYAGSTATRTSRRRPPRAGDGRNHEWRHLYNADVISMPDKWEYPWYAAWDLAFHCMSLAMVDAPFAKEQLAPAAARVVHAPERAAPRVRVGVRRRESRRVHAWAALRVYQIEAQRTARGDRTSCERVFHKLLLNFTWWVNRKDARATTSSRAASSGSTTSASSTARAPLPPAVILGQSDGTSWMAMYCLNLSRIALELALDDPAYEDVALKFFEHFLAIAHAMNHRGDDGMSLWDEEDGFFYDVVRQPDGARAPDQGALARRARAAARHEVGDGSALDRLGRLQRAHASGSC